LEQSDLAACTDVHRRVEAGVLAAGAALGRYLVVELVFDLYLVRLADLAEVQGDDDLSCFTMIDNASSELRKGMADLARERAAIQLFEEFSGIGGCGHACFSGRALSPLGGRWC